ncbi:hypothetical protein, partial [Methylogaea oryzae]|uniref:hypothetical protein n=1 Tax=Methylogaea oryzae TaxID=1295382 RepID=UPI001C3F21D1
MSQDDGTVGFQLRTSLDRPDLLETFAFFVQPEDVQVFDASENATPAEDGAYGFFDDAAGAPPGAASADDGYGFFDGAAGAPDAASASDDDGFGFFVSEQELKAQQEDAQGYGFFGDVAEQSTPSPSAKAPEPAQPYGFFVDDDEIKKQRENTQGYGFFVEPPGQKGRRGRAAAPAE